MTRPHRTARRQLEQFLATLFRSGDLIELRFIESWVSCGKKRSRVVRGAEWLRREEFVSRHREITHFARRERANVYFGVCSRPRKGDSQDDQIRTVRCLWCDIDDVMAKDVFDRWSGANVPLPSIVVSSGSGIHGYWLLDRDIRSQRGRALIAAMLPHFYHSFGGDHVQNLSRILRPPGTANCKDARNGRPPQPCSLLSCRPDTRYSLETFDRWIAMANQERSRRSTESVAARSPAVSSPRRRGADEADVLEIVRHLDRPARDRSRRDFAVICDLLRLGLNPQQIWPLVASRSKFKSNGLRYFEATIANAERAILFDQPPRKTEGST